jgi:hypothetical protein
MLGWWEGTLCCRSIPTSTSRIGWFSQSHKNRWTAHTSARGGIFPGKSRNRTSGEATGGVDGDLAFWTGKVARLLGQYVHLVFSEFQIWAHKKPSKRSFANSAVSILPKMKPSKQSTSPHSGVATWLPPLRPESRQMYSKGLLLFLIWASGASSRHKLLNLHMRAIGRYVFRDHRTWLVAWLLCTNRLRVGQRC